MSKFRIIPAEDILEALENHKMKTFKDFSSFMEGLDFAEKYLSDMYEFHLREDNNTDLKHNAEMSQ